MRNSRDPSLQRPALRGSARGVGQNRPRDASMLARLVRLDEFNSAVSTVMQHWAQKNLAAAERLLGEPRDAVRKHIAESGESFLRGKIRAVATDRVKSRVRGLSP